MLASYEEMPTPKLTENIQVKYLTRNQWKFATPVNSPWYNPSAGIASGHIKTHFNPAQVYEAKAEKNLCSHSVVDKQAVYQVYKANALCFKDNYPNTVFR